MNYMDELREGMIEESQDAIDEVAKEDPKLKNTIHMNGMVLVDLDEQNKRMEEAMNKYPSMAEGKLIF